MSFIFCHFPELSPSRLCPLILMLLRASPHPYPSFPLPPSLPAIPSVLSGFLAPWPTSIHLGPFPEGSLHFLPPQRPWLSSENRDAVSLSRGACQSSTSHIAQGILRVRHCYFQTRTSPPKLIPFKESMFPNAFSPLPQPILSRHILSLRDVIPPQLPHSVPSSLTHRKCPSYLGPGGLCFDMEIRKQAFSRLGWKLPFVFLVIRRRKSGQGQREVAAAPCLHLLPPD